jgi:hypothetical protein
MGRGGTVLGIIGIILAAGSIGFTFIVWSGQNTTNSLTETIVVGIWDEIDQNLEFTPHLSQKNWLFEFGGINLTNTDYISTSNNNTRITLLKPGWYRIHLSVGLASFSPNSVYSIIVLKDGVNDIFLDTVYTGFLDSELVRAIDSSAFVYSDGTNYFEINGVSDEDYWPSLDRSNQLTIEYVAT